MADPAYGMHVRLWADQGANAIDFSEALGSFTIQHETVVSGPHAMADRTHAQRYYPIPGSDAWGLEFGRYLLLGSGNSRRLSNWFQRLNTDTPGNMLVDLSEATEDGEDCLYFRKPVRGSARLALPMNDVADLTGTMRAELAMPGIVGARATLGRVDADSLLTLEPEDGFAVTAKANSYILLLTEERVGTVDLELQRKRGAGAWTDVGDGLLPATTTDNSLVEVHSVAATGSGSQAGDLFRVRFSSGIADGNSWTGKMVSASEDAL